MQKSENCIDLKTRKMLNWLVNNNMAKDGNKLTEQELNKLHSHGTIVGYVKASGNSSAYYSGIVVSLNDTETFVITSASVITRVY